MAVVHHDRISPVGAGFLGAGLTAAVFLMVLGAAFGFGFLGLGRKRGRNFGHTGLGSAVSWG